MRRPSTIWRVHRCRASCVRVQTGSGRLDPGPWSRALAPGRVDRSAGFQCVRAWRSRTASGKPILLGNPHLSWSSLYWEAHVRVPGRIDFYGSTLAGIPGSAGRLQRPARVRHHQQRAGPGRCARAAGRYVATGSYVFDGRSMRLTRRDLSIKVRNDDGSRQAGVAHVLVHASRACNPSNADARVHGQVYAAGRAVLRGLLPCKPCPFASRMARRDAAEPGADVELHVCGRATGTFSICGTGVYQFVRMAATTVSTWRSRESADLWSRLHPIEELPQLLNPPGGYIQNANNPPQFVSLKDPIDMTRYPSYSSAGRSP